MRLVVGDERRSQEGTLGATGTVSTSEGAIGRAGSRGTGPQRIPREGAPETAGKQRSAHPVWAREQFFECKRRPCNNSQARPKETSEAAALRAQSLVVAYLALTAILYRDARLSVRPDGEERAHTESLCLVEMDRIVAAVGFMRQRVKAVEKDIIRGLHVTSLVPRRGFHNGGEAGAAGGLREGAHGLRQWRPDLPSRATSVPRRGPRWGERPEAAAGRLKPCGYDGLALRKARSGRKQKQAKDRHAALVGLPKLGQLSLAEAG